MLWANDTSLADEIYQDLSTFDSWGSPHDLLKFLKEKGYEFEFSDMEELADIFLELNLKGKVVFGIDGGSPSARTLEEAFINITGH